MWSGDSEIEKGKNKELIRFYLGGTIIHSVSQGNISMCGGDFSLRYTDLRYSESEYMELSTKYNLIWGIVTGWGGFHRKNMEGEKRVEVGILNMTNFRDK